MNIVRRYTICDQMSHKEHFYMKILKTTIFIFCFLISQNNQKQFYVLNIIFKNNMVINLTLFLFIVIRINKTSITKEVVTFKLQLKISLSKVTFYKLLATNTYI